MTIIGWKTGANTIDAIKSIRNHTGYSLLESKRMVETALEGKPVVLPDDFVLREELESFKFILD